MCFYIIQKVFAAQNQMAVNPPGLECLFGMHKDPAAYNVDLDQGNLYSAFIEMPD